MSEPSVPQPAALEDVSRRRTAWLQGVPAALTVVIFLLIFWRIPFGAFWNALAGARMLPFLALMGSFSLCFFLLDTVVLSRLIRWFHGPLPYRELLPVRAVTYLVSILNTQLAQAALALYVHRRFHTPLAQITGTVALMILLETTNLILFATVGALAFPGGTPCAGCLRSAQAPHDGRGGQAAAGVGPRRARAGLSCRGPQGRQACGGRAGIAGTSGVGRDEGAAAFPGRSGAQPGLLPALLPRR
jgi:hypothetical protein